MEKSLVLVRGLPDSGKTTFATLISGKVPVVSADNFFEDPDTGKYEWDASKLPDAHKYSQLCTRIMMEKQISRICVANTFTTDDEMLPYYELADIFGYRVFSIIVENRHGNISIHDVPKSTIENMKTRFKITL